jgi:prevent-host-death family protein
MVITAKELRMKTSKVLKDVQRLGSVTVTLRGKPVEKLVSVAPTKERKLSAYRAIGMWADREDMKDVVLGFGTSGCPGSSVDL